MRADCMLAAPSGQAAVCEDSLLFQWKFQTRESGQLEKSFADSGSKSTIALPFFVYTFPQVSPPLHEGGL